MSIRMHMNVTEGQKLPPHPSRPQSRWCHYYPDHYLSMKCNWCRNGITRNEIFSTSQMRKELKGCNYLVVSTRWVTRGNTRSPSCGAPKRLYPYHGKKKLPSRACCTSISTANEPLLSAIRGRKNAKQVVSCDACILYENINIMQFTT